MERIFKNSKISDMVGQIQQTYGILVCIFTLINSTLNKDVKLVAFHFNDWIDIDYTETTRKYNELTGYVYELPPNKDCIPHYG